MSVQNEIDYSRIEKAIRFINENYTDQPSLEEIAAHVHVSPHHFQRMFKDWAGVSPKKFVQYLTLEYAKKALRESGETTLNTAHTAGFSGTSRLHDLFVTIEGMTPGEFKNGGEALSISYSFRESPFGRLLIASTPKGICRMAFEPDEQAGVTRLQNKFPAAQLSERIDENHEHAARIFDQDWSRLEEVKLHLSGTPFQLKVWECLLRIPQGTLTTYGNIAKNVCTVAASRAVGSAIGQNPIAYLIPCHRVIRSTGKFGEYRWGSTRKTALIGWEASRQDQ